MGVLNTLIKVVQESVSFNDTELKSHTVNLLKELDKDLSGPTYEPPDDTVDAFDKLEKYVRDMSDEVPVKVDNEADEIDEAEVFDEDEDLSAEADDGDDEDDVDLDRDLDNED